MYMANQLGVRGRLLYSKGQSGYFSPMTNNRQMSSIMSRKFRDKKVKLDFSDVLIVPRTSELTSRKDVNIERAFTFRHSGQNWNGIPLAVSNMDTTGTINMALEMQKHKVLTCLHKYYQSDDITDDLDPEYFAVSTGISDNDLLRLEQIMNSHPNIKFICVDVANGYMEKFVDVCKQIRERYPKKIIIAGNVVTPEQVRRLIVVAKVDIVKLGIGSGSVCTTRLKTGVGYPQLSAILDCHNIAKLYGGYIMSDGGIQNPGDLGKAYGAGADFVMCGSLFAGHKESGGDIIEEDGNTYKIFYGMSSKKAMVKHTGQMNAYRAEEGKVVKLKYRGLVKDTLDDYIGGLRSTLTYVGAKNIRSLYRNVEFIRVNHQVNQIHNSKEIN